MRRAPGLHRGGLAHDASRSRGCPRSVHDAEILGHVERIRMRQHGMVHLRHVLEIGRADAERLQGRYAPFGSLDGRSRSPARPASPARRPSPAEAPVPLASSALGARISARRRGGCGVGNRHGGLAQLRISRRLARHGARTTTRCAAIAQHAQSQQYPTQLAPTCDPWRPTSPPCARPRRHRPPPGATRPARSCVTPTSCEAISMVLLLCVMKMNCTLRDMSRTMSQKRPTLFSSSGASTSSSRQNGAGFRSKIANTSATAVSAFSPPDSWLMVLLRLPGGRAMTDTPADVGLLARRAPDRHGRRRTGAEISP